MNFKVLFMVSLFLFSCKKKASETAILVIGHAGMGLEFSGSIYHDNSEEAFQLALEINEVDGIEMDVRLSADGDLWAFHDETLDKETNKEGCLEIMNFSELDGIKYKGSGSEKLKRLKDMDLSPKEKRLFLDLKHLNTCSGTSHDVNKFIAALNDLPAYYHNTSFVRLVTSNQDWVPALLIAGFQVVFSSDVEAEIDAVFQNNPNTFGIVIKNNNVTKAQVAKYLALNKSVYLYNVRAPKSLNEAGQKNPTGVMSDDVQSAVLEYK